ncbi:MAG TPA: FKBP-type peptidyl-prolyl cis-trans isomerase [Ottowia sp.]|jgi:FKBP-type peptidyl-prolyl cis-trans isomerase SlpA|nr:FKBP-type peptidyl-prolyl cis-trans isomerase [Ottowia sp.]OJV52425.1 MAG: peptidylprolyl isomerase [Burkholderiales bacterium 68-10]HMT16280.1 FKBP-type peptidyl-prolyl cis-trans isomerase [Ottowia sp.]HMT56646.1 FKBP-type peptidyl-prolyl cis-trans isomerase [Ottowia sp.]HMT65164.1 FKBP-type peptidyl-prolyl cis-trans isomerase [Ottowia sp.]
MSTVEPGSFLTLHYRLSGPQGDVVSTFGGPPATLSLGSGQLSPAVERRLLGLQEGARASFDMPAGEAFGERNPDMIQWLARQELDELGDPQEQYAVGDVIQLPTPDGQGQFGAVVQAVRDDGALRLDFNHPLAGLPVTFEVQVIGIL